MQDPGIIACARHPEVETALRCGRCETPICPRCMVHTPGGIRCPDCAQLRRPPMYELALTDYARAFGVALLLAPMLGYLGALLLPSRGGGMFVMLLGALAGWGAGSLVAGALSRATHSKRGLAMQLAAGGAIVAAAALRYVLVGASWELILRDFSGALLLLVALSAATGRLR